MVSRPNSAMSGAPATTAAFTPSLPTHVAGDRLLLWVSGKDATATIPTVNNSWVLLKSGTGGTGTTANDTGQTFWAVYGIDATSSSQTAPTVTPGATLPDSWEWITVAFRPGAGKIWLDSIGTSAAYVQSASDTTTAVPLTGTCGAFTGVQPAAGDAIVAFGVVPTDTPTAVGTFTLTATGLSGGTVAAGFIHNQTLGTDSCQVWGEWSGFTGTASAGLAISFALTSATNASGSVVGVALRETAGPDVSRIAVTSGAPATAAAFAPTLPTHAAGDRLFLVVSGKDATTTNCTINQGWTRLSTFFGGTGTTGNDAGGVFISTFAKDATSSAETAPTVTPGATAPDSWEWFCFTYRPGAGKMWADSIALLPAWSQGGSDTSTASPLTATCSAWTGAQPTAGDAILLVGGTPTDLGTALGATTLTATGLSGGTKDTTTTNYVENSLGGDSAAVWADWTGFTGTASAGLAVSIVVTGATNHSGTIIALAIRQTNAPVTGTISSDFGATTTIIGSKIVQGAVNQSFGFDGPVAGTVVTGNTTVNGTVSQSFGFDAPVAGTKIVNGSIAQSFGATTTIIGVPVVVGSVNQSFGFTSSVLGVPVKVGTVSQSFGFDAPVIGNKIVTGTVSQSFGFSSTVLGSKEVDGSVSQSFGLSAPVVGVPVVVGTVSQSFGFSAPVIGVPLVTGTVAQSFGLTAPVVGTKIVQGSVNQSFGFSAPVVGTVVQPGVVSGTISSNFGFSSTVLGVPVKVGTIAQSIGFSAPVVGTVVGANVVAGAINQSFGFSAPAIGVVIRLGEVGQSFGFVAPVVGTNPAAAVLVPEFTMVLDREQITQIIDRGQFQAVIDRSALQIRI